jgi:hypothetical protein
MLIACPSCQRQLNVPDHAAGKQVRCPAPDCGSVFYVPTAPEAMPPPIKRAVTPRPAVPKPVAPPPPPASAPFDFGASPVAGPIADFGFTESTDGGLTGIRMRTRLSRAAGWLNVASAAMVLFALFIMGMHIAYYFLGHNWWQLVVAGCPPFLMLLFPVAVFVGARMLSRGRRWGMALAAAIISLAVGAMSLVGMLVSGALAGWVGYNAASAQGLGAEGVRIALISSCGYTTLLALVSFSNLFAGFVALRTVLNAEVKATFT